MTVPIIKIPIDDDAFNKFIAKYEDFRKSLKEDASIWKDINQSISGMSSGFDKMSSSLDKMDKVINNPKFTGKDGSFEKITKQSETTSKHWDKITKDLEKGSRFMTTFAQASIRLGAFGGGLNALAGLGGLLGLLGGFGAALYGGTVFAAADLGQQNVKNRQLGLKQGELQAFKDVYGPQLGVDEGFVTNVATAQLDRSKWQSMMMLGIGQKEIQNKSATELSEEILQNVGKKYKEMGAQNFATWVNNPGNPLQQLGITPNLARAAADPSVDFKSLHERYVEAAKDLEINKDKMDAASKAMSEFKLQMDQMKNSLEQALVPLFPSFIKLGKAATNLVSDFAKSSLVKEGLDDLAAGLEKVDKFFMSLPSFQFSDFEKFWDAVKAVHEGKPIPSEAQDRPVVQGAEKFGIWLRKHLGLNYNKDMEDDLARRQQQQNLPATGKFVPDPNKKADFNDFEQMNNLPRGLIYSTELEESGGGNPKYMRSSAGALGPMQFMPKTTGKQYGLDENTIWDEKISGFAAGNLYGDLMKYYHGDLEKAIGAYNAGTGRIDEAVAEATRHNDPEHWMNYLNEKIKKGVTKYIFDVESRLQSVQSSARTKNQDQSWRQASISVGVNVTVPPGHNVATSIGGIA